MSLPLPDAWLVINEPTLGLTDQTARLDVANGSLTFNSMLRKRGTANIPMFVNANDLSGVPVTAQVSTSGSTVTPVGVYSVTGIQVGNVVTINGTGGYTVTASGTTLQVTPAPGTHTNVTLVSGPVQYCPTIGAPVYLRDITPDGTVQGFAGTIDNFTTSCVDNAGNIRIEVSCVSLEAVFDTVLVSSRLYQNVTCGFIFADLLSLVPGAPITAGTIDAGATLASFVVSNYPKISDLFEQLATQSLYVWGVDPSSSEVYFHAPSAVAAPFELETSDLQFASFDLNLDRKDYRNRQLIQTSYDAFAHSSEKFDNAQEQNLSQGPFSFALLRPVQQVTNAWFTFNTQSTAVGTFSGQPSAGDTITITFPTSGSIYNWKASNCPSFPALYALGQIIIDSNGHVQKVTTGPGYSGTVEPVWSTDGGFVTDGPPSCESTGITWTDQGAQGFANNYEAVYVFVTALDNTQWGQVLIGATLAATIQNLVDAINNVNCILVHTSGTTVSPIGSGHSLAFIPIGAQIVVNGVVCTVTSSGTNLSVTPSLPTQDRVVVQTSYQPMFGQGVTFSFPTWENPLVNADNFIGGTTVTVRNKSGDAGYIAALTYTPVGSPAFSWSAPSTSGGLTKPNTSVCPVGIYGTLSTSGLAYQPGSNIVSLAVELGLPPNVGLNLQVEYTRADGDSITVENTSQVAIRAAIEHGTGMYQQRMTADQSWTNVQALAQVQSVLAAYCVIPQTFKFQTLRAGLLAGSLITVVMATPAGFAALVNGRWCAQEIEAEWVPKKPWMDPALAGPWAGHFRYTPRVIDVAQIGDFIDFWQALAGGGGGGGTVLGGGTGAQVATSGLVVAAVTVSTSPYDVLACGQILTLVGGSGTVNLPDATSVIRNVLFIYNASLSDCTLVPHSGDTINGQASLVLTPGSFWQHLPNC